MPTLTRSLVFICAVLLLISTYVVTSTRSTLAQAQQPAQTVEQVRKNIQVIKGLPDAELVNLMNFVASSLGVRCEHCHVTDGKDPQTGFTKWIWESDDKPEKNTARRMMRMVMSTNASNKADFRDNAVTCFTCHRGQLRPAGLPPMPLAKSGHEADPNEAPTTSRAPVPSVEQILATYVEAVGGSAVAATKTMVMKGKREASQNRIWPTEITWSGSDRFRLVTTTPQNLVTQIVNGENGWALAGPNLRTLGPKDIADNKRSWTELFGVIKVKDLTGFRSGGATKIDNRDVFIVEKTTDAKTERYYFDAQTGLLVRKNTIGSTVLIPLPDQIDFLDYRDVDGVKVPFTIRYSGIDTFNSWTRTFTEIKRNVTVDDSVFAKPVVAEKKIDDLFEFGSATPSGLRDCFDTRSQGGVPTSRDLPWAILFHAFSVKRRSPLRSLLPQASLWS